MIKIARGTLPEPTTVQLEHRTELLAGTATAQQGSQAKRLWKSSSFRRQVYPVLREALNEMAPGLQRCMFCGDSEGTAVDHFEPMAHTPLRTFDWLNHVLACSKCNSEFKQDRFPLAPDGTPLLIDPTSQDPADHLHLLLAIGEYRGLTTQGTTTIGVLQLNRGVLVAGRRRVYRTTAWCLADWHAAQETGQAQDAAELRQMLWEQPLADVVDAMLRQAEAPGAEDIFADDIRTLTLLRDPKLRAALLPE